MEQPNLLVPKLVIAKLSTDEGEAFDVIVAEPHTSTHQTLWASFPQYDKVTPYRGTARPLMVNMQTNHYERDGEVHQVIEVMLMMDFTFIVKFEAIDFFAAAEHAQKWVRFLLNWPVITQWSQDAIKFNLIGRKVWWREMKARVLQYIADTGSVLLEPDLDEDDDFLDRWRREPWSDVVEEDLVKRVSLLETSIVWSRE